MMTKMIPSSRWSLFAAGIVCVSGWLPAQALQIQLTQEGNFTVDNEVAYVDFSVAGPGNQWTTVLTTSWVSGGDVDDPPLPTPVGFDPIVALWVQDGGDWRYLGLNEDSGGLGTITHDGSTYTYGIWDSFLTMNLAPGNYRATISQYDNYPNAEGLPLGSGYLSDGFLRDGTGNEQFTQAFTDNPQDYFNGAYDSEDRRSGYYRIHVGFSESGTSVPDAGSTAALLPLGLGALLMARRRMR